MGYKRSLRTKKRLYASERFGRANLSKLRLEQERYLRYDESTWIEIEKSIVQSRQGNFKRNSAPIKIEQIHAQCLGRSLRSNHHLHSICQCFRVLSINQMIIALLI
jgi:hypothetical protein